MAKQYFWCLPSMSSGCVIGSKHASVALDPQEFLTELYQHQGPLRKQPSLVQEEEEEEANAKDGVEHFGEIPVDNDNASVDIVAADKNKPSQPIDLPLDGEPIPELATQTHGESTAWQSTNEPDGRVQPRMKPLSSPVQIPEPGDDADGDPSMMAFARRSFGRFDDHDSINLSEPESNPDAEAREGDKADDNGTGPETEEAHHSPSSFTGSFHRLVFPCH